MTRSEVVVNRQTVAVAVGTLAVVLVGGFLLYGTPAPKPTGTARPVAEEDDRTAKAKRVGDGPRRLGDKKLVHANEIPADRPAAPAGAPNVVVVFVSTQRRDQWSVYGGPDATTPFLKEKAATGARMMDALAVAVDPRPAAATLITGQYPHAVGLVETEDKKNFRDLPPSVDTMAERLQRTGWFTVGLSANHHLNLKAGAAQGFDWYRDSQPFSLMLDQRIDAKEIVEKALERVSERTDAEKARPMYLQLAFVESHKPFKVPPDEFKPFEKEGDPCDCAPYRATIRRVDDALRKLSEGLAAQGLTPENTVFVVVADHGEGLDLPPAHRKQHGFVLYRSTVQIPWILWGKGVPAGRDVAGLASQLDVVPTVLALAGLPKQEGLEGVDLSGAITGKTETTRDLAYADTFYDGAHRASVWTATRQCQKDYGSVLEEPDTFTTGCFDRVADPDFTTPVADEALAAKLEAMHAELLQKATSAPVVLGEGKAAKGQKADAEGKAAKGEKAGDADAEGKAAKGGKAGKGG
jgi:arylsulfatase A-like enzyme